MPPSGIFITGIPGHRVGDLRLQNVVIELEGGGEREHGRQLLEEKIDTYPEINRFGPRLPAFGMYARHVDGLTARAVGFKLNSSDSRPALVCSDCRNSSFTDWKIPVSSDAESVVRLESASAVELNSFYLEGSASAFVRIEGKESNRIRLTRTSLPSITKRVEFGTDANSSALTQQ
jgi:hypothetical protein